MAEMREGFTYVPGRSAETAKALLASADKVGVERRHVKTQQRGYIVPDAVAKDYSKPKRQSARSKKGTD